MSNPLVSICTITYNQASYIKQCLDGILMQQCNFPIEVIINDDCSTDGTKDILNEYATKYPDVIKIEHNPENLGANANFIHNLSRVRGKYVALCEGDDYWDNPHKLQKQVDFLEAHPEYSICYHKVAVVNYDGSITKGHFPYWLPDEPATFELCDMEEGNIIQTNSVMYRWRFHEEQLKDFMWLGILPGDWLLHLLHAAKGRIYYMPEVMGAYRHHAGGIWSAGQKNPTVFFKRHGYAYALFFKNAREVLPLRFEKPIEVLLNNITHACLREWEPDLIGKVREIFPEEMDAILHALARRDDSKRARFARKYSAFIEESAFLYRVSRFLLKLYLILNRKRKYS